MLTKFGQRRIVRVNDTRWVSLPKAWLDTVEPKEGESLDLGMAVDLRPSYTLFYHQVLERW